MDAQRRRDAEAGFTLVEALTAIVVLVFGLMAVTNLMLVAASSNSVANQGTAATTSASRILDMLKATRHSDLALGGDVDAAFSAAVAPCEGALPGDFVCRDDIPGVGRIFTRWAITSVNVWDPDPASGNAKELLYIRVRSEGMGAMAGARSRAEFTTFRSCTDSATCDTLGAAPGGGGPPPPSPTP